MKKTLFSLGVASALVLGQAYSGFLNFDATAQTAPRSISGESIAALSANVALQSGQATVTWLAPETGDNEFAQAAANAAVTSTRALVAQNDVSATISTLHSLGTNEVRLVGSGAAFSPSYQSALASEFTVTSHHISEAPSGWSVGATDATKRTRMVVANSLNPSTVKQGASFAIVTGRTLVLSSGEADSDRISAIAGDAATQEITAIGDGTSMDWMAEAPEQVNDKFAHGQPGISTPSDQDLLYSMISSGSNARELIVSKDSDIRSVATAALYAKRRNAAMGETAAATDYVGNLRSTLTSVTVVGTTATDGDAVALEGNYYAGPPAPTFRIADIVLNAAASTTKLTYTAKAGAVRYLAYDASGVQLGTSTGTTLTYSGVPEEVLIVAEGSAGTELARLQVKVNNYESAADRQTAIIASSDDTGNHLRFIGAKNRPRLVTRTKVDPLGGPPAPSDTTAIGLTCGTNITDAPQESQYQFDYRVTTLNNNSLTCAGLPTADSGTLDLGGVSFPADQAGVAAAGAKAAKPRRTASVSLLGQRTLAMAVGSGAISTSATGDNWPPIKFRYQTFIIENKVPGFMPESLTRPFTGFHGDNRNFYHPNGERANGSPNHFRTRQDVTMHFGSSHHFSESEQVGESIRYACRWPNLTDCVETARTTAPNSELSIIDKVSGSTSGSFRFKVDATLPLQYGAPAITANVRVKGRPGRTTITGKHDRMPIHEIWWTVPGWTGEWYFAYGSEWSYLPCLAGSIPGCTAVVNVSL